MQRAKGARISLAGGFGSYEVTSRYELGRGHAFRPAPRSRGGSLSYAEFEFEAGADVKYHIWSAEGHFGQQLSDAFWIQFRRVDWHCAPCPELRPPQGVGTARRRSPEHLRVVRACPTSRRRPSRLAGRAGTGCGFTATCDAPASMEDLAEHNSLGMPDGNARPGTTAGPVGDRERRGAVKVHGEVKGRRRGWRRGPAIGGGGGCRLPAIPTAGRTTKGAVSSRLQSVRTNFGVMRGGRSITISQSARGGVRRRASQGATGEPQWKPAGVWYLAGSNTCIYSNPREELGATQHNVQTSNRGSGMTSS